MTERNMWRLESVTITDLLGFQGETRFQFSSGLQVLEASNHTGKSSLALATLWGLTGEIPKLARIDQRSFRLTNKHAGANANPRVGIALVRGDGSRMEIRRTYTGPRERGGMLEVSFEEMELTGSEAGDRILSELGTKPATLEGCGIVLQDHRLKLVTGSEADISEVINDMLGLQALSEVVPCLQQLAADAERLRKEVAEFLAIADPVARWNAEDQRLRAQHRSLESAAVDAGIDRVQLENPAETAQAELTAISEQLSADAPATGDSIRQEVERLRAVVSLRRKEGDDRQRLSELGIRRAETSRLAKTLDSHTTDWVRHDEHLLEEQMNGETNQSVLASRLADTDQLDAATTKHILQVENEQQLLAAAYTYVLGEASLPPECPVCEARVEPVKLRQRLKERLEVALSIELESLAETKSQLERQRAAASERLESLKSIYAEHERLYRVLGELNDEIAAVGITIPDLQSSRALFEDSALRRELIELLLTTGSRLQFIADLASSEEAEVQKRLSEREDRVFQPLDGRINRIRDYLLPIIDSVERMGEHDAALDLATQRESGLTGLSAEVQGLAGRLKKLAKLVSEDQEESARMAINSRLPFVADFFAKVARNPDYTGLTIDTTVSRDKVAYRIRAASSKMAALADSVGHVLSEGDLSAAGIALLLGLASGDSHRLGLLMLDDPGQGMDPELQENLARELASLEHKPQIIVLTHQPDFAASLEAHGSARNKMGIWSGGRIVRPT